MAFLLENCKEFVKDQINQLSRGKEVVRWVEEELETLIPQLERIEDATGLPKEIFDELRDVIRRAEDLSETYTKREIQRDAAAFKAPIYTIRVWRISKQLHKIKRKMVDHRDSVEEALKGLRVFVGQRRNDQVNISAAEQIPSHLRRCIHYLLLFPPDFKVPARRLIALWVAEGLVRTRSRTNQSVEQIAERYLNELVAQKVISFEQGKAGSGKAKAYWIDVGRRADLLEDAKNANFFQHRNDKILRLADCNDPTATADSFIQVPTSISDSLRDYRDVISFLSFNTQEGSKPGEEIGDFLRKCISARCFVWLRVLDLERVFRPQLPATLGKLIGLKYLGLRWTYLEHLPDSVEKLFNLQVLDVKHTYITVLPRSIWRMQYLRHLYLSEAYRTRFPVPPLQITLTALQSLWGAFVDEDTCVKNGLDTLLNVRKLGLSCRSRSSKLDDMKKQLEAIDKWISKLEFLESLRLKSRDESGEAVDLHLTSLAGNRKLSTVYLLGRLDHHGLILCKLPVSLTDITLSGSALDLDPMPFLGRLPNLVNLRLLAQSVVWKNMYCPRRGFRRLKFLWIWKLENLEEFEAEEGSLPSLEELEIRSCNKLGKLPHRLSELENLEIKLTSMPPEFVHKRTGEYAQIHHVPRYDQYILKNISTRFAREEKGRFPLVE